VKGVQMLARKYTNEEIMSQLDYYNDVAWEDVPHTIREQINARYILIPSREPTELEQWETIEDAREHRITNNEMTIKDITHKYTQKRKQHV